MGRVSKERLRSPRARLFVALDLPDAVRGDIAAWGAEELADPALRPTPPAHLHITLCFLSWQPERRIEEIAEVIEGTEHGAVALRFLPDPVTRPPRGRPKLFALEARSEAAIATQAKLSQALELARAYEPEKRPFWPHVTVARVRSDRRRESGHGGGGKGRRRTIRRAPESLPETLLGPFGAVRITLYRSNLRPAGAEYVPLASFELPPAGGEEVN